MRNFWIVIILLAALIGSGLYFSAHEPAARPGTATSTNATPSQAVAASTSRMHFVDKDTRIVADIDVPTVSGHANAQAFNDIAKVYVDRATEAFAQSAAEANFNLPSEYDYKSHGLMAGAKVETVADRYVSVVFAREYDMLSAAHPFHTTETLVYDLDEKKVIELSHIFSDVKQALEYIASKAAVQVKANLAKFDGEESFIADGAAPEEANYRSFAIDAQGITFFFAEYQVAPYAAGPQKAVLTWADLRPLLSSQFKSFTN